ncbi:hypothetical protein pipiens_005805 [Culex pipiens pipiens]|uniref:G-protein coupled receptors family 1 profile domain-containing protein n=1 Tax=Culex pipiens pipiens TaxID=38569 RepID=A0ABD1DU26_CULPP
MDSRPDDKCTLQNITVTHHPDDSKNNSLGIDLSQESPRLLLPTITTKISQLLTASVSSSSSTSTSSLNSLGTSIVNISSLLPHPFGSIVSASNFSGLPETIAGSSVDDPDRSPVVAATAAVIATTDGGVGSRFGIDCSGTNFATAFSTAGQGSDLGQKLEVPLEAAMDHAVGGGVGGGSGGGVESSGQQLLLDNWQDCVVVILFCLLIIVTVIGNTLVILSVITTRRLRTVTNCFVMSLAVADWLVGIFVMPPAVAVHLLGTWPLGWILCDIWISLDVLLCTASILSLCAISIDRYLAVTQPLNYSRRRRSKRLALLMILVVWVLALAITCPPILGWYEPGRRELDQCRYNQNEGYVVFSAMGSFFIPMAVMIYVYVRISCVVASRHDKMTEIEVHKKSHHRTARDPVDEDCYHYASEIDPAQLSPKQKRSSSQLSTATTTYVTQLGPPGSGSDGGGGRCVSASMMALGGDDYPGNKLASQVCGGGNKKNHKNGHYELVDINSMGGGGGGKTTTSIVRSGSGGGEGVGMTLAESMSQGGQSTVVAAGGGKRNSTIHYKLASTTELWSSANNVFNQQPKPQVANHPPGMVTATGGHGAGLRRTNTISNSITASTTSSSVAAGRNLRIHQQKSLSSRILSMKRENKTTQTLSIVVGGFIACWLPFFIHYIITPFLPKELAAPKLGEFFTWLGWINSAINPFIYAFYSVDFRAAFWRLTLRRFFRNSEKAPFANIHNMSMRR